MGMIWWSIVQYKLFPTSLDYVLTLHRAVLVSSIIPSYDIEFSCWINYRIHDRYFQKITSISFPYLIQRLHDVVGVPALLDIDNHIEVNRLANVELIHNDSNLVAQNNEKPFTYLILVLFKRPFDLTKKVERLAIGSNHYK